MRPLNELPIVEETKHLTPIREIVSKRLFGEDAYFIEMQPSHRDTATNAVKRGDGMVWLPWQSEIWLLEVEWKNDSNFHEQIRSFAQSAVSKDALEKQLLQKLSPFQDVLKDISHQFREGFLAKEIVKRTTKRYFSEKNGKEIFTPDLWVILGHSEKNISSLQEEYKRSIESWYHQTKKRYILSTARAFSNEIENYVLLEQQCSEGLKHVPSAILFSVPAWTVCIARQGLEESRSKPIETTQSAYPQEDEITSDRVRGRAAEFWQALRKTQSDLDIKDVRLRIHLPNIDPIEFFIEWHAQAKLLLVKKGQTDTPNTVARALEVYSDAHADTRGHAARKYGLFVDVKSGNVIARFRDLEKQIKESRSKRK